MSFDHTKPHKIVNGVPIYLTEQEINQRQADVLINESRVAAELEKELEKRIAELAEIKKAFPDEAQRAIIMKLSGFTQNNNPINVG
jgi:DNA polymerase IIIc chi subunit